MAENAKFFIIGKNNKPKVLNFSKEEVLEDIKSNGLNPADFKIFAPDEYQNYEIENARRKQIEEDEPFLSKMRHCTHWIGVKEIKK